MGRRVLGGPGEGFLKDLLRQAPSFNVPVGHPDTNVKPLKGVPLLLGGQPQAVRPSPRRGRGQQGHRASKKNANGS